MPLNATLEIQKMPEFQINTKNVLVLETFNKYELGFTMHTMFTTGNIIMLFALMLHAEHVSSFFGNIHNCRHNHVLQLQRS